MRGVNLVRKKRKKSTGLVIIIGAATLILGGGTIAWLQAVGRGPFLGSQEGLDVRFVDVEALDGIRFEGSDSPLDYLAIDPKEGVFARGAVVTFTMLPRLGTETTLDVKDLGIDMRSFTPLTKLVPPPTYDAPSPGEDGSTKKDVGVSLSLDGEESAQVSWQSSVLGSAGVQLSVKAVPVKSGSRLKVFRLLKAPGTFSLATLNAAEARRFVATILLSSPGRAVVGLRAYYAREGKEREVATKDSITLVYNPQCDAGSLPYHRKVFETVPTFPHAIAFRDALLRAGLKDKAVEAAQRYRLEEAGPDADWLAGDTYRKLGQLQKAYDEGFSAVSRERTETLNDERHKRYDEVRAWLTDMVQAKKIQVRE